MNPIRFSLAAAAMASLVAQFSGNGSTVNRPVKLFEAGSYPDKGVDITPEDLDCIVSEFNAGAASGQFPPVKTEHRDTPLDPLGEVVAVTRHGNELYGVLAFAPGIHSHIQDRNVQSVSVGLAREMRDGKPVTRLTETSLVFAARVAGAGFLSAEQIAAKLATFAAAGKLTPAMTGPVTRLLSAPQAVTFSDGSSVSVAAEVEALLNALPVVQNRNGSAVGVAFAAPGRGGPNDGLNLDARQKDFLAALKGGN
jgi:hypothetical protein